MARTNGKSEVDPQELDGSRELPESDGAEGGGITIESPSSHASSESSDVQKLKVERDTLIDRLARLQAEFENARKRTAREQQDFREYAVADAIKALLPIVDSFERAMRTGAAERSEFHTGIDLIYKQLQDALQKLGLRAIPAKGEPFDPHLHEAIEMVDTSDAADHQILEELQPGYKLKDRLLRPAMVKVARNPKH